jgi:hypothetical protein
MKTSIIVIAVGLCLLANHSFCQSNNPYNQKGIDYVNSLNIILDDVDSGQVSTIDQTVINNYTSTIPFIGQATVEMAGTIMNIVKTPKVKLDSVLENSTLSESSKNVLESVANYDNSGVISYQDFLTETVTDITVNNIWDPVPQAEKEMVLTIIASAYHISGIMNGSGTTTALERRRNNPNPGCVAQSDTGETWLEPGGCIILGATVGAITGYSICGWLCAAGGAVIGGVLMAIVSK